MKFIQLILSLLKKYLDYLSLGLVQSVPVLPLRKRKYPCLGYSEKHIGVPAK